MKHHIDEAFVNQLFAHPVFQNKLKRVQQASINHSSSIRLPPSSVSDLVEQICTMLSSQYKQRVDEECLSIYNSHVQIIKEIQNIKSSLALPSPSKTVSSPIKDRLNNSLLSQVELELNNNDLHRANPQVEYHSKMGTSFMSSFLCENESKDKEELQERINASIVNLSGDMAKFETSVERRLKNVEESLSRKMESIYKTLTSVFETINDLQSRLDPREKNRNQKTITEPAVQKEKVNEKLNISQRSTKEKAPVATERDVEGGRRRSFLGFFK